MHGGALPSSHYKRGGGETSKEVAMRGVTQHTERVEQRQVVASSLTRCTVIQERTKTNQPENNVVHSSCCFHSLQAEERTTSRSLSCSNPLSLRSGAFYTPTHSLPSFLRLYADRSSLN